MLAVEAIVAVGWLGAEQIGAVAAGISSADIGPSHWYRLKDTC